MAAHKPVHPLKLAWAAGVFDAKVLMPKTGVQLRIDTTNESLLIRFKSVIKYGSIKRGIQNRVNGPYANFFWTCASMDDTREVLLMVLPFLSPRRLKEASSIIAMIERNHNWLEQNPTKAILLNKVHVDTVDQVTPQASIPLDGQSALAVGETPRQ